MGPNMPESSACTSPNSPAAPDFRPQRLQLELVPDRPPETGRIPSVTETSLPKGAKRVAAKLAELGHPREVVMLPVTGRTAADAAAALGVELGQIAKSIIFRRRSDDAAVLVVTSGDLRVDEQLVTDQVGELGRADASFVKESTGFSIGGVSPVGHTRPPVILVDAQLFRFAEVWAAAGHPYAVFPLSPDELVRMTSAPVVDVTTTS